MPDQAIHDMQQAMASTAAAVWDVKLAVDLEAAILFTETDYDRLSAAAQEQALAKGYERGDPVKIGFTVERGTAPVFMLFSSDDIPNLELIRTTREPRISPEAAERMRELRLAMPTLTEGQMEWAKAEFHGLENPLPLWVTAADDIRGEDGVFGHESIATRSARGVDLLDDRLIDDFAGDSAAEWLRAMLDDGSVALVHSHRFDLQYLRGRADPERMLRALAERWQAEPAPPAPDPVITAEPIEQEPAGAIDSAAVTVEPCWFCGGVSAPEISSDVLLYDPVSVERSVESVGVSDQYTARYQQLRVAVPRCTTCFDAHFRELAWKMFGIAAGILVGGGAAYALYRLIALWGVGGWLAIVGWAAMALVLIAFAVAGYRLGAAKGKVSRGPGINPEAHNLEFPVVKQFMAEGYKLGKPEAKAPE